MTDVQDATPGAEPSMEEILASIRRIIADEKAPAAEEPPPAPDVKEDILELTQMVQDDGSVADTRDMAPVLPPEPAPLPEPIIDPVPAAAPTETLISAEVAATASSSLSALASMVQVDRRAEATHSYVGDGSRTLEDMVLSLMKPLLKEWLDKNLPAIVDRIVQKEVERIARKAQD